MKTQRGGFSPHVRANCSCPGPGSSEPTPGLGAAALGCDRRCSEWERAQPALLTPKELFPHGSTSQPASEAGDFIQEDVQYC